MSKRSESGSRGTSRFALCLLVLGVAGAVALAAWQGIRAARGVQPQYVHVKSASDPTPVEPSEAAK